MREKGSLFTDYLTFIKFNLKPMLIYQLKFFFT